MTLEIKVEKRDASIKNDALRVSGKIPAVYYMNGKESVSITIDYVEFVKLYREAGESTMITLKTADGDEQALVQAFQLDPVSGKVTHVDFKLIEAGKPIEITVPLQVIGTSPAVSEGLGLLMQVMEEVTIKVLPKDLPSHIDVDISVLATLDDSILVKDIQVPATVEILSEEDATVATVNAVKEEVEEEEAGDIDFSAIEVEKKGKEEVPEEEAAA